MPNIMPLSIRVRGNTVRDQTVPHLQFDWRFHFYGQAMLPPVDGHAQGVNVARVLYCQLVLRNNMLARHHHHCHTSRYRSPMPDLFEHMIGNT
ncbi:MAG: hypothetical protein ABF465_11830, partial [Acetobacter orientalis]